MNDFELLVLYIYYNLNNDNAMRRILLFLIFLIFQLSLVAQKNNVVCSDGLFRSTPEAEGVKSEGILKFIESVETCNMELHSFMLLRHGPAITIGRFASTPGNKIDSNSILSIFLCFYLFMAI